MERRIWISVNTQSDRLVPLYGKVVEIYLVSGAGDTVMCHNNDHFHRPVAVI